MSIRLLFLPLALLAAPGAFASGEERQQLGRQRAEIEARHQEALQACATRFNVNSCQEEARRARLQALKPVQARELALDAAERQARSERQRERVLSKQQEFAEQDGRHQSKALLATPPLAAPASAPKPARSVDEAARAQAVQAEIRQGERDAAQRRSQAAERRQKAQAHREASERRQQARAAEAASAAASSKPAARLPQPTAADLARLPGTGASAAQR